MSEIRIKKNTIVIATISLVLVALVLIFSTSNKEKEVRGASDNVVVENGIQTINITSQGGGYSPKVVYAQAGIPTKLIMNSVNSYGCERSFQIPSLKIYETLPAQGETIFDLGELNKDILGTCSMGMYTFVIKVI